MIEFPDLLRTQLLSMGDLHGIARDFLSPAIRTISSDPFVKPELSDIEKQEPWAWAAIDLGLVVVSMAQAKLWEGDPQERNVREAGHTALHSLLQRPNGMTTADSVYLAQQDWLNLIRSGESFWFLQDREGQPVAGTKDGRIELPWAIWPVDGSLVEVVKDKQTGLPRAYKAPSVGAVTVEYPPHAVLAQFHRTRSEDQCRGIGPIGAALGSASQNYIARRYTDRLLRNDGRVAGVVIVGGHPTDVEIKRLKAEIASQWNNPSLAGQWRLATGDAKVQSEPTTPRDMEFRGLLEENKKDLAAVLQTPGALLGLDTTNYATFAGHFRRYLELRIVPWLEARSRALNERLLPRLRDPSLSRLRLSFDTERIRRICVDPREESESVKTLAAAGVPISIALQRAGVKVDPIEGGEVPMVAAGQVALTDAQAKGKADAIAAQALAAQNLVLVGVDPDEALAYVGLELTVTEDPVEEDPNAQEGDSPADPSDKAGGAQDSKSLVASRWDRTETAPPALPIQRQTIEDRASSHDERRARAPQIRELHRRLRGFWSRMRLEQIRTLERFAASGELPELVRARRQVYMPRATAEALLEAAVAGRVPQWRAAYPRFALYLIDFLLVRALGVVRGWTDADLERLVIAGSRKWQEELASILAPVSASAFTSSSERTRVNLGLSSRTVPAEILQALADKATLVAEGSTSAAAAEIRYAIARVLAEKGRDSTSLQAAIRDALVDVKAGTTRAFRTLGSRALAIARTEVNGAAAQANYQELLESFRKGLISGVRWLTSGRGPAPGGTVRDSHFDMEGQTTIPGGYFVSGRGNKALHPYGFGVASEDINCECRLQAILAEGGTDNTVQEGTSDDSPDLPAQDLESLVRAHEDVIVKRTQNEAAVAIDSKGRTVLSKIGKATSVEFRAGEIEKLKGTIFTHNHPSAYQYAISDPRRDGNSLSPADVAVAIRWNVAEMRAVSAGYRHSLRPGPAGWPALAEMQSTANRVAKEMQDAAWSALNAASGMREREALRRQLQADFFDDLWTEVARLLGMLYSRVRINA